MLTDIIPAPDKVSAHQRRKAAHTMEACGHGILYKKIDKIVKNTLQIVKNRLL